MAISTLYLYNQSKLVLYYCFEALLKPYKMFSTFFIFSTQAKTPLAGIWVVAIYSILDLGLKGLTEPFLFEAFTPASRVKGERKSGSSLGRFDDPYCKCAVAGMQALRLNL